MVFPYGQFTSDCSGVIVCTKMTVHGHSHIHIHVYVYVYIYVCNAHAFAYCIFSFTVTKPDPPNQDGDTQEECQVEGSSSQPSTPYRKDDQIIMQLEMRRFV